MIRKLFENERFDKISLSASDIHYIRLSGK